MPFIVKHHIGRQLPVYVYFNAYGQPQAITPAHMIDDAREMLANYLVRRHKPMNAEACRRKAKVLNINVFREKLKLPGMDYRNWAKNQGVWP